MPNMRREQKSRVVNQGWTLWLSKVWWKDREGKGRDRFLASVYRGVDFTPL